MAENMLDNKPETAQASKGTAKYEVEVTCFWNGIFYREGTTVELPSDAKLPEDKGKKYFKKL
jgi:hypothetical protein